MLGLIKGIGHEILGIGAAILGGVVLFFTFRSKYVGEGERRAHARATGRALQRAGKGLKNAQKMDTYNRDRISRMLRETGAEY